MSAASSVMGTSLAEVRRFSTDYPSITGNTPMPAVILSMFVTVVRSSTEEDRRRNFNDSLGG
ncbi:MAG: hypothetical protein ACXV8A_00115 [Chthoniobacterales bacterium]